MDDVLLNRLSKASDRVVHTHGSAVFLRGEEVFKVKKAVDFGFLDYSTLQRRGQFCLEEVRLNRRWSQGIYLGVVPIGESFDDDLEPVEWAVHMRRYEEADTLLSRWRQGTVTAEHVARVGRFVAQVHARCPRSPLALNLGTARVFRDALEGVFDPPGAQHVRHVIPSMLYDAVRTGIFEEFSRVETAWEARNSTRELHGDLRMEHVLLTDSGDINVVDALEFNDALRCGDPVLDVGFLAMDLAVRGSSDLANAFVTAWVNASDDAELLPLLPVAAAYRSCVRGKVAELFALDPAIDEATRLEARQRALRHWLWSASLVRPSGDRPLLLGVGGLPGAGKSTVAAHLAESCGMTVIRADVVRKERAGLSVSSPTPNHRLEELYNPNNTRAVYQACLSQAQSIVACGGRALIDATFADPTHRNELLALGQGLGVATDLWLCEVPEEVARSRMTSRPRGPSDADVDVLKRAIAKWKPDPNHAFDTSPPLPQTLAAAAVRLNHLEDAVLNGLMGRN